MSLGCGALTQGVAFSSPLATTNASLPQVVGLSVDIWGVGEIGVVVRQASVLSSSSRQFAHMRDDAVQWQCAWGWNHDRESRPQNPSADRKTAAVMRPVTSPSVGGDLQVILVWCSPNKKASRMEVWFCDAAKGVLRTFWNAGEPIVDFHSSKVWPAACRLGDVW